MTGTKASNFLVVPASNGEDGPQLVNIFRIEGVAWLAAVGPCPVLKLDIKLLGYFGQCLHSSESWASYGQP